MIIEWLTNIFAAVIVTGIAVLFYTCLVFWLGYVGILWFGVHVFGLFLINLPAKGDYNG